MGAETPCGFMPHMLLGIVRQGLSFGCGRLAWPGCVRSHDSLNNLSATLIPAAGRDGQDCVLVNTSIHRGLFGMAGRPIVRQVGFWRKNRLVIGLLFWHLFLAAFRAVRRMQTASIGKAIRWN
jgi:hypothetical protein